MSSVSAPLSRMHVAASTASTVPTHGPTRSAMTAAGAWTSDPRAKLPGGRRDAPRDEGDDGLVGQLAWLERRSDGHVRPEPIDPERPPVDPVRVPGDQVPAPAGVDQAMRLDPALARAAVPVVVVEAQLPPIAADPGQHRQHVRIDRGPRPLGDEHGVRLERGHAAAQPDRQDLLELGERAQRRFLDAGDRSPGARPETHRERDGLVIVEQQRRQRRPGREPVAADRPARGVDRIAETAQPFDVVPDRPRADLETLGQLRPRPVPGRLEQREEPQEPRRGSHVNSHATAPLGTKSA